MAVGIKQDYFIFQNIDFYNLHRDLRPLDFSSKYHLISSLPSQPLLVSQSICINLKLLITSGTTSGRQCNDRILGATEKDNYPQKTHPDFRLFSMLLKPGL